MNALEQSFAAICEANGLMALTATFHAGNHKSFAVNVHWRDAAAQFGQQCRIGDGETLAEALQLALAKAAADRAPSFADVPLTAEEMAELIAGDEAADRREAELEHPMDWDDYDAASRAADARSAQWRAAKELAARNGGLV